MAQLTVIVIALSFVSALAVPLLPKVDNEERIVGGYPAADGQHPYQVSLRNGNSHFCGGSIINNYWVLTAGHCTYGLSPQRITIVVGTNYLNFGGTRYGVYQIIIHSGYNPQTNENDISLLQVSDSFSYNRNVGAIGLASSILAPNSLCILSGWGLTSYPSEILPNDLQYIYLQSISVAQCQSALPGYPVYNTHVCTFQGYGKGACQGDSGGPLVSNGVQVGVVSWGIPCAKGSPDIFTAVSSFRSWIYFVTGI